ncbi:DUF7146 domain-containing protein [Pleomorphomonas koreensis]|uniref:DUF7146 domain-containing protein n=1 Tax=Pleomorphomonas koreensis TaxID=257440 RepID=UPI0004005E02|nr:hypothetical protein [Pleomorphomonas koreensis]
MSYVISIDALKERLLDRVESLVLHLFPEASVEGNNFLIDGWDGGEGQALRICFQGNKAGWVKDFRSGEGGDLLTLIARAPATRCDGEIGEAIKWAIDWLGIDRMSREDRHAAERRSRQASQQRSAEAAKKTADLIRASKRRYLEAEPLFGSPAERYLVGRGLPVWHLRTRQDGKGALNALRYHPSLACPETFRTTGRTRPALIGQIIRFGFGHLTIHRIFLEPDGAGGMRKATDLRSAKQAYSEFRGGIVPVWRGDSGKPIAEAPAGEWIAGAEGIEDAVAMAIALPEMRTFAAVSLSNLGSIVLPPQIGGIYWHRHRGDPPEAVEAFERAADRLGRRGIKLREVWAPGIFKDFTAYAEAEYRAECAAAREAMKGDVA